MIITLILVAIAVLALLFLNKLAKGHASFFAGLSNPGEHIQSVNVEAFRNLVDPREEEFLRDNLPPMEFRRIQRERLRVALEYISAAAQNAAILVRLGEAARRSSEPTIAEAGDKLVNLAIQLRLYAFPAMARLYIAMIFPGIRTAPVRVADGYEQMTRLVVRLKCLQYPTQGVTAEL